MASGGRIHWEYFRHPPAIGYKELIEVHVFLYHTLFGGIISKRVGDLPS